MTCVSFAGEAVAAAAAVAKKKKKKCSLLIATPAKMKMHPPMLLPQGLHVISWHCQQVRKFLPRLELFWSSLQADVLDDGCSLFLHLPRPRSLGLRVFIFFLFPPTNADALGMMQKGFEPNAYLIEGRQARAVNKRVCHSCLSHQSAVRLISPEPNYTR